MRLLQLDLDLRPRARVAAHHRGEDLGAHALERADAQRARLARRQCGEIGLSRLEARHDRFRVAEQQPPRLGERDRPRPARPLDEPFPDRPLERRDLLADGRLRVAELVRGTAERALFGEGLERRQMADFDAEPTIRFHDRNES